MLPYRDSRFATIAIIVFFVIAIMYALFEARGQILGPTIEVTSDVSNIQNPYIVISGQVQRISSLSMNGQPISVSENGAFTQPYLLSPGYNRIILDAKDNWGRTAQKVIEIMFTSPGQTPSANSPAMNASEAGTATSAPTIWTSTTTSIRVQETNRGATTTPPNVAPAP